MERNTNLILARGVGERVLIGDDITVTVVKIQGEKARLAISAPANMLVDREEVRARRDFGGPVS